MSNEKTDKLAQWDQENVIHPVQNIGHEPDIIFCKGHGIYLEDTNGKVYIDGQSQLTCLSLGYGQKEIHEAIASQLRQLEFSTTFFNYSTPTIIECSRKLAELTPKPINHFIYTTGGSDSTDTAFRLARTYWRKLGKANKFKIISLYNGYHGASFGAVSATAIESGLFSNHILPLVYGFIHVPNYFCYRCPFNLEYPSCDIECARYLGYAITAEGKDTVAAFIAEPVQGAGGCIDPPPEYWPLVRKICSENDVLLIADEVMTGFCRTGKMFAVQHWNVVPDIITLAKGLTSAYLPMGAVGVTDAVYEGLKGADLFGVTYSGHPTCAAAAIKTMEIYVRDKIAENVTQVGQYTLERLNRQFLDLPCVGDISGLGLMLGIEIVSDKKTKKRFSPDKNIEGYILKKLKEKGLMVRIHWRRIAFTPPLIITKEEVDKALDIMYPVLATLKPE